MEYSLSMVFITKGSKKATFTINGIKENLTGDQVNTLMNSIIAQNIFTTDSGDLVSKDSAEIIAKTVSKIQMTK